MLYKTRKELGEMLIKEYGEDISICLRDSGHTYTRFVMWGIYKPAGKMLEVWDGVGNLVESFLGYKPVNGGTVVYLVN